MWGKLDLPFIAGCGNGRRKPWVKDVGDSPEAEKKNEMDSHSLGEWDSPKSYGRNAFLLTSWYYSRRIIVDFSPTELLDKTSVSFSATKFVVICYSSLKKKKKEWSSYEDIVPYSFSSFQLFYMINYNTFYPIQSWNPFFFFFKYKGPFSSSPS